MQYDEYNDSSYADIQSSPVRCGESIPTCARLQLEDDPNERRTILLYSQFASFEGNSSEMFVNKIRFRSLTFLLDGNQTAVYGDNVEAYSSGQEFVLDIDPASVQPSAPHGYGQGPFLADISLLDLSAPRHTAAANPTGCAALHPSATYAVRLLFASAVYERDAFGGLAPFGTNATTAAAPDASDLERASGNASTLFSIRTAPDGNGTSPDRVVGMVHAPGGSVVDVCVAAAAAKPQVEAVVINCNPLIPLSPAGFACDTPIKAYLQSLEDERAGRDPATFPAGPAVEFCLEMPEFCPGGDAYAPTS